MKAKIIAAAFSFLLFSCATEMNIVSTDVPQTVLAAFQAKYPEAKDVEWEIEKEQGRLFFEAEWKVSGKEREAYFRPDGSFVREE